MAPPKPGAAVVDACIFCGMEYDEPQKLGSKIDCDAEEGGCGAVYKIVMLRATGIKESE